MKYKIIIQGMHCNGCKSLLTMLLEERGFTDVLIDIDENSGRFVSNEDETKIKELLDAAFKESENYSYKELSVVS